MPIELLSPGRAVHGNPDWYALRRQGVTASEIAVILGLSRWDSPWSLWHRKRGLIPDQADNEDMQWGRRLESGIADAAAERLDPHKNLTFTAAGLYRHSEREWQMATPDRLVRERRLCESCDVGLSPVCTCEVDELTDPLIALLEVKHPYSWDGWGDDGTDDVPVGYQAQCLWQLDTMDLDECWLAAYTRHQMRIYTIRRSVEGADADLAMMRARALEFLALEDPPPLDAHPATLAAVKALHPDVEDREQQVDRETGGRYLIACAGVRAAEQQKRVAEAALREELGNARYALLGDGTRVATRSVYERRQLDSRALRADHPDLAEKYTTTSTTDRLTPARKDTTDEQGE